MLLQGSLHECNVGCLDLWFLFPSFFLPSPTLSILHTLGDLAIQSFYLFFLSFFSFLPFVAGILRTKISNQ
jgi:hypothetical protein